MHGQASSRRVCSKSTETCWDLALGLHIHLLLSSNPKLAAHSFC